MDSFTIISGAIFFVCLMLFSMAYFLNNKQIKMENIQRVARKLGLLSIMAIIFESVLMDHLFAIHIIALINAVALWVFGLLEEDENSTTSNKEVSGVK